jgi:ribonuclease-3 family protein
MEAVFYHPPSKPPGEMNPLTLAYAGDAIYELFIRGYVISRPNHRPNEMHRTAVKYVSAKAQAAALAELALSEAERDVVRRGRNAKSGTAPKNTDIAQYRHSTAFECLLGYLYYTGEHDRLREIMEQAVQIIEGRAAR